jgi:hypothetical protein
MVTFEKPTLLGLVGFLVALDGHLILFLPGNAKFLSDIL